jgi:hypothetical protein
MIEREVTPDQALNWKGELLRAYFDCTPSSWRRRACPELLEGSSALHLFPQNVAALLEIKRTIPNRPDKPLANLLPMKDLA